MIVLAALSSAVINPTDSAACKPPLYSAKAPFNNAAVPASKGTALKGTEVKYGKSVTYGTFESTPLAPFAVKAATIPLSTDANTFGSVISFGP